MARQNVLGVDMDCDTRCAHYRTELDIVALRFGCCGQYYACHKCHGALTDHDADPWPTERRSEPAVYCGACETTLLATEYLNADACPVCESRFNPGCSAHYALYFEWVDTSSAPS